MLLSIGGPTPVAVATVGQTITIAGAGAITHRLARITHVIILATRVVGIITDRTVVITVVTSVTAATVPAMVFIMAVGAAVQDFALA